MTFSFSVAQVAQWQKRHDAVSTLKRALSHAIVDHKSFLANYLINNTELEFLADIPRLKIPCGSLPLTVSFDCACKIRRRDWHPDNHTGDIRRVCVFFYVVRPAL
jgi:hypothetical protein